MGESNPFKQPVVTFRRLYGRFKNHQNRPFWAMLYAAFLAFPIAMIAVLVLIIIMATVVDDSISVSEGIVFLVFLGPLFLGTSPMLLLIILLTIPKLVLFPAAAAMTTYILPRIGFRRPRYLVLIWIVAWTAIFYAGISLGALSV